MSRDELFDPGFESDQEGGGGALPGFLMDPMGVLQRRWKWMFAVCVLGISLSLGFLFLREPSFTARATVVIASQRISEEFVTNTVVTDQLEKVNAILGELMARRNLAALIEKYDLIPNVEGAKNLTMEEKVALIRQSILIRPDTSTGNSALQGSTATVFEVIFSAKDPVKAAAVANDLASAFTDIHLRIRSRQARLTTEFLRRELGQTERELAKQERAITEFKQKHRGELPSELRTNMGRLDRLQSQRQSLALQIASVESRLATLAASGTDVQPDSQEAQLRALQNRYQEYLALYTPEHPNVVALENQIAVLEEQMQDMPVGEGGSPSADAARIELAELRRQLDETVAEYDALDKRVAVSPQREEQLAALEQRADILRESYREFLRKVKQAELSEAVESAQQGERATILDPAIPPTRPSSSPLIVLVAFAIGTIGASVGIAILLELVDAVVVSESEIEDRYGLAVLGTAGRVQ